MATTLPRTGMVLQSGSENVDVTIYNGNFQKMNDIFGLILCTSTTRPSSPIGGQQIFETDTQRFYYWSSSWVPLNSGPLVCTSSTRPGAPLALNQVIYETDTGRSYYWDGDSWELYGHQTIGGKSYATAATLAGPTSGTTELLAGMDTGPVALKAGRRYRISMYIEYQASVVGDWHRFKIRDTNVSGTQRSSLGTGDIKDSAQRWHAYCTTTYVPAADETKTFVGTMSRIGGSGTVSSFGNNLSFPGIWVEHLGPASVMTTV
jgi:hypothetical protein